MTFVGHKRGLQSAFKLKVLLKAFITGTDIFKIF